MKLNSRVILFLIFAFLALPFVAGTGLYLSGWRPGRTVNHGILITPPATLATPGQWAGKWSLLLIHDAPCGVLCAERLNQLGRIRISLGQEMGRTRVVWMGQAIAAEAANLKVSMPDLSTLDMPPHGLGPLPPGSVILVDPNGLAMMRYAPDADPRGMRADLERLLKYVRSA
ncbi:MAG: putative transrane protein [Rhodocyclaceae bacterium]|nr:putative transrane protein [Rhodocyclaceae bacterium]